MFEEKGSTVQLSLDEALEPNSHQRKNHTPNFAKVGHIRGLTCEQPLRVDRQICSFSGQCTELY